MSLTYSMRSAMIALIALTLSAVQAFAQSLPGVTDTEIRVGQTNSYSGPLSLFGTTGQAMSAYFDKINAEGGINGRMIRFISLDDAFSPPKTVEQTRKLIESEEVLLVAGSLGTAGNIAVQKYLNGRNIPQLLVQSGSSAFNDPARNKWSTPGLLGYEAEARAFARYILSTNAKAKVGVLRQNDDFGRDYMKGMKTVLSGVHEGMIVAVEAYEVTSPTVDSEVIRLKASGADTIVIAATGRTAAQTIRKIHELGWRPTILLTYISNSISAVMKPAGLEASTGVVTTEFLKDPGDGTWKNDPDVIAYRAWMAKYFKSGNVDEKLNASAYTTAQMLVDILRRCGGDLSRENVLKQAVSIQGTFPMLLPGIQVSSSDADRSLFKKLQFRRFDGERWAPIDELISAE